VLKGSRFDQRRLVVFYSDTLSEQLRGDPARKLSHLPLAVTTPRAGKHDFRHQPTLHADSGGLPVFVNSVVH
jgi:hypothetical protein